MKHVSPIVKQLVLSLYRNTFLWSLRFFSTPKPPLLLPGWNPRLKVGGFGLGLCWGWQNESHVEKHGESWGLQQPVTHNRDGAFALQAAFAIIIAPGDRNSPSSMLWLPPVSHVLHQLCLVQLLKRAHTQMSWPYFAHMRGHTLSDYTHTHSIYVHSHQRRKFLDSVTGCFYLNLRLVSGALVWRFHGSHTHSHTKIHCVDCHVMASSEVELA